MSPTGKGWGTVAALTVLTASLSVLHPGLLIFTPLGVLLLALAPRRPVWLLMGGLVLFLAMRGQHTELWDVERGWALIVSGWFVAAVLVLRSTSFLNRALAALAAAVVTAAALVPLTGGSFGAVDARVADQLRAASGEVSAFWRSVGGAGFQTQIAGAVDRAMAFQVSLYPALLALATITGLAVAWWGFERLTAREEAPLQPLREFSFNDGLVWLFIAGLALYLLPSQVLAERAGTNLLAFMCALYALRGLAVVLVFAGMPGPVGIVLGAVIAVLLYPFVVATTFFIGLLDTWLHLRKRRLAAADGGNGGGER